MGRFTHAILNLKMRHGDVYFCLILQEINKMDEAKVHVPMPHERRLLWKN